jgi:acyl-CoA thioester hydrolase
MDMQGKLVHVEKLRMRWGEMDALGHMNNTVYFRYLEQARIAWFDSLGISYRTHPEGPVLGNMNCRFRIPILYPANLAVTIRLGQVRKSSFPLYSEIYDESDPTRIYATAEAMMVWIDIKDGKSRPVPEWLRGLSPNA